jgi:hypothetical protein
VAKRKDFLWQRFEISVIVERAKGFVFGGAFCMTFLEVQKVET